MSNCFLLSILHKAAIANEKAQDSLSKSQELMLTGDTTEGVSKTEGATESASCDDESGEKVWTVTAYTEQGITCKEFKDGVGTLLWQIDFKNPTDYNKVMDYLDNEKQHRRKESLSEIRGLSDMLHHPCSKHLCLFPGCTASGLSSPSLPGCSADGWNLLPRGRC